MALQLSSPQCLTYVGGGEITQGNYTTSGVKHNGSSINQLMNTIRNSDCLRQFPKFSQFLVLPFVVCSGWPQSRRMENESELATLDASGRPNPSRWARHDHANHRKSQGRKNQDQFEMRALSRISPGSEIRTEIESLVYSHSTLL